MASYDSLRHVSIGQYVPAESPIHSLDPRAKLIGLGMLIVAVAVATTYTSNLVLLLAALALVLMARLPLGFILAGIKPALPVIALFALLQLLFYGRTSPGDTVLVSWGLVRVSAGGLRMVIVSLMRFVDLLLLTSLITNTTTTSALNYGIESLLRPFSALGLPGHELALVGSIALRFLPILGEEMESIGMAQASRTVAEESAGRWHLVQNTRRVANLIVPLFVDAYRRSEELALAMQARCYHGGRGRTHLVAFRLTLCDYAMVGLTMLVIALIAATRTLPLP